MTFGFNLLLKNAGVSPVDVRLLRHQDRRSDRGRSPYELWRDDRPAFDGYQGSQMFANRSKLSSRFWASFVVTGHAETLFAGLYACRYVGVNKEDRIWTNTTGLNPAGTVDCYDLKPDDRFEDLAGRVVIHWGGSERAWIQRADNQDKPVLEIRASFREPDFPGFGSFIRRLSEIDGMPAAWVVALSSSRGVYLLTCPKTKEQYVGSATGSDGFFGRWLNYVQNGHGGNVGLRSRDLSDYQVAILEVAGSAAGVHDILSMEALWKQKLRSREMGLNRN